MRSTTPFAIDRTITLDVNGSIQHLRLCAARAGLPPLLVVQGGPALPVLHEVAKFQRLLKLEDNFLVAYWDQRGCGAAAKKDANSAPATTVVRLPRAGHMVHFDRPDVVGSIARNVWTNK